MISRQSESVVSSIVPSLRIPAAETTASRSPSRRQVSRASESCASSATSTPGSIVRSMGTVAHPRVRAQSTIAAPIPEPAPVTTSRKIAPFRC